MTAVVVLSPHRDDAVFSLSLALRHWAQTTHITVLNFCTVSAYGPHAHSNDAATVSFIRKREDRRALRLISDRIQVKDCDFLDAPLRLNVTSSAVCAPETALLLDRGWITALASRIREIIDVALVLSPLALGEHVDHIAVRRAAIDAVPGYRLGFYEDLPYACWTDRNTLMRRISEIEQSSRSSLQPAFVRAPDAVWWKRRAAARYQSQINRNDATVIANFSARYSGGERLWLPYNGLEWNPLLQ